MRDEVSEVVYRVFAPRFRRDVSDLNDKSALCDLKLRILGQHCASNERKGIFPQCCKALNKKPAALLRKLPDDRRKFNPIFRCGWRFLALVHGKANRPLCVKDLRGHTETCRASGAAQSKVNLTVTPVLLRFSQHFFHSASLSSLLLLCLCRADVDLATEFLQHGRQG
ncbi:MAG: hypothetical protein AAF922_12820 [Pseudomonadota bacterium]